MRNCVTEPAHQNVLVIGWGNELLGDDAAGRRVAQALEEESLPGVEVVDVHQLTPELALRLVGTACVIFVDACPAAEHQGIQLQRLAATEPGEHHAGVGHTGRPEGLLAMADELYGARPEAWLVAVPARSFEPGDPLSETVRAGIVDAVEAVKRLARGDGAAGAAVVNAGTLNECAG